MGTQPSRASENRTAPVDSHEEASIEQNQEDEDEVNTSPETSIGRDVSGPIRLMLRDRTATTGPIDGAWWPRTDQPMTELHQLVAAVAPRIGKLARLGFDWTSSESGDDNTAHNNTAKNDQAARIMHVVGSNGAALALLVIPAATEAPAARSHMRWAAGKPRIQDPAPAEKAADGPRMLVQI
ncbi:DUF5994 family protein [Nocardia sp. NPDC058666]|uniref:DUF5994 family protein n=1 Tax=unclassified Nocardia TaxID=2637762 RepID=UPI00365393D4